MVSSLRSTEGQKGKGDRIDKQNRPLSPNGGVTDPGASPDCHGSYRSDFRLFTVHAFSLPNPKVY